MKSVTVAVSILCLILISHSNIESVDAAASDCYDACTTGCVQPNVRRMRRCEAKCRIKCGPDSEIEDHLGRSSLP